MFRNYLAQRGLGLQAIFICLIILSVRYEVPPVTRLMAAGVASCGYYNLL